MRQRHQQYVIAQDREQKIHAVGNYIRTMMELKTETHRPATEDSESVNVILNSISVINPKLCRNGYYVKLL